MKILVYSHDWAPTIGGLQTATMTLARGLSFHSQNHTFVTLVTPTPAAGMDDNALPLDVVRHAGIFRLIRLLRNHDVIHVAGPAFLPLLMAWLLGKKIVVQHHGYQAVCPEGSLVHAPDGAVCPNHFLKGRPGECVRCRKESVGKIRALLNVALTYPRLWLCRRAAENVAVSEHVRRCLVVLTPRTIENGVRDETRTIPPRTGREIAPVPIFAYVGWLVREKGVDVLLHAAAELRGENCPMIVRIIGDGPERNRLESPRIPGDQSRDRRHCRFHRIPRRLAAGGCPGPRRGHRDAFDLRGDFRTDSRPSSR